MTNCWIFDDIYGENIYHELKEFLPQLSYPIKKNIDNPIPYLTEIKNGDFVVLDNFFFWEGREQPLGDDFLWQYLKLKYKCKIICISNYGEKNIQRFPQWYKAYCKGDIIGFVPSKSSDEIAKLITYNLDTEEFEESNSDLYKKIIFGY